jgi:hypothetical protein
MLIPLILSADLGKDDLVRLAEAAGHKRCTA